MSARFDRDLLQPLADMEGGKGTAQYRRVWGPAAFSTPWAYLDQVLLPPGASIGPHLHRQVGEVYYVVKGRGEVTVSSLAGGMESAAIHEGDAVPLQLGEVHSFANTGTEPLEMLVIGVSRDASRGIDDVAQPHFSGRPNGSR
jgi:mannose-6-phosphate isomerase-like protein (cupin superfamily)